MDLLRTEQAIHFIKRTFQDTLAEKLSLHRVSAPLFVDVASGIQDNLNGIERPVSFEVLQVPSREYQIVQSLAKWKRLALSMYDIAPGEGIYTDMNALRPDEDNLHTAIHSIYVDQWDWEKVMKDSHRDLDFLKNTVKTIYSVLRETEQGVVKKFNTKPFLPEEITFIHTEELMQMYPDLDRKEREDRICKEKKAVFLIGIGGELSNGEIHDGRAPDYDDWTTPNSDGYRGLNGDILVWNPILNRSFELSSMGIRVDPKALMRQLEIRGCVSRKELPWHKRLLNNELPQSVGGGIGQSRICMLLLQKRHIGEVQVSTWPEDVIIDCEGKGIRLL
ncbi:MAG: aspartate--ammonia ligase [Spirochaetia bacterium]